MTKEGRIYNGEKKASSVNSVENTGQLNAKKSNWTTFSHHTLKMDTDLNVRVKTIKLVEENIGSMLFDFSLSNIFLDMSPQMRERKAKVNKWNYIKLKSFCIVKETSNKTKWQPTEWEKMFANYISDMG